VTTRRATATAKAKYRDPSIRALRSLRMTSVVTAKIKVSIRVRERNHTGNTGGRDEALLSAIIPMLFLLLFKDIMTPRPDTSHIQSYEGNVRDYNGSGPWSVSGVKTRYRQYCDLLHIANSRLPEAATHQEEDVVWIYPIMEDVIRGIEDGDAACIALGVDFVEQDSLFAFGKRLKSNTARALRWAHLTEEQKERLRERIVTMLISGIIPHEMREYAKLLRVIGLGEHRERLERDIPRDNPFAMRFYNALRMTEV
jgi:hypothetical protein